MRLLGQFQTLYHYFFFYKKILQVQKTPKAPKAQRRNQVKAQSANRRTKAKNALKNI